MANEEQLSILRQGVEVWNRWRERNPRVYVDLREADLRDASLSEANLRSAILSDANLRAADLSNADISEAHLSRANLFGTNLAGTNFAWTMMIGTIFGSSDLSNTINLDKVAHHGPSAISTDVLALSKGKIPELFLRGCGLSDWEIEHVKLYNPHLNNDERNRVLYRIYDLQASQAIQISPLFISYSHTDSLFIDKVGKHLNNKGIRYWRDIHDMKAGRMETQIDRAISQNRSVLLVLSEHSLKSDWVEHEVRTARGVEKDTGHDVLCPIALDDSWKDSRWPKHIMEQIMEYNILDFSEWKDDVKFESIFRKLIDGLELFYKG